MRPTRDFLTKLLGSSMLVLVAGGGAGAAQAQSTGGSAATVEEVIVTATRRNESLQDVPLSISAFSQQALDRQGVTDVANLVRITPGVSLQGRGSTGANISIRGIASSVGAGTTGIYIDDTPVQVRLTGASQSAASTYPTMFDLERVEVLRGPQGTLFGAGSEGGTIRFITPQPSLTSRNLFARAQASAIEGGGVGHEEGVALGGPIIDGKLGFRLSAYNEVGAGWIDRIPYPNGTATQHDINSHHTVVVRGALKWAPTDDLNITAAVYRQDQRIRNNNRTWPSLSNYDDGKYINGDVLPSPARDRYNIYSVGVDYDLGGVKVFSNTSYFDRDNPSLTDYSVFIPDLIAGTGSPRTLAAGIKTGSSTLNAQRVFTQEVRLQSDNPDAKLQWVVGAFYQRSAQRSVQTLYDPQIDQTTRLLFGAPVQLVFGSGLLPGGLSYIGTDKTVDKQTAVFGQLDYRIAPAWTLSLGARYAKMEFAFTNDQVGPLNGGHSAGAGAQSEQPVTPKIGLRYEPSDDVTLYATAAKGYRPGGGNVPVVAARCSADLAALGLTAVPTTYQSDSVWSYEGGLKARAFDRRLQFEGSIFHIDWKDIQNLLYLSNCGFNFVTNLGAATSQGVDAKITAKPIEGLTLDLAVAYTRARYSDRIEAPASAATGVKPVLVEKGDPLPTPPWFVAIAADYQWPLERWGGASGFVRADYNYRSGYRGLSSNTFSYDPLTNSTGHSDFLSARAGVRRDDLEIALFADNLLNSDDRIGRFRYTKTSPTLYDVLPQPRTIGVSLTVRR